MFSLSSQAFKLLLYIAECAQKLPELREFGRFKQLDPIFYIFYFFLLKDVDMQKSTGTTNFFHCCVPLL